MQHLTQCRFIVLAVSIVLIATAESGHAADRASAISTAQMQQSPDNTAINQSAPADTPRKVSRTVDEVRFGVLSHDAAPFESNRPESGIDLNAEVRFVSPELLSYVLAPRPHLGLTVNTNGETNQLYGGLTWTFDSSRRRLFFDLALGFSVHDGELDDASGRRLSLGSRVLFRVSGELGFRFSKAQQYSISGFWDHASNGGLFGDSNQGIDTIGVRFGYSIP